MDSQDKWTINVFETHVNISNETGIKFRFYHVWLRDHCRCNKCYNFKTHQVSSDILEIPLDIKPTTCEVSDKHLKITWKDGHVTEYLLDWLEDLTFPLQSKKETVLWNTESFLNYTDIKVPIKEYFNKEGLTRLLRSLLKYGIGFVTAVEPTLEATRKVVEFMAPVQQTFFGEMWKVTNDYYHSDTAYTNIALGTHTDNTYFTEPAGLQVFHMLSHEGSGGETLLADGFNLANILKQRNAEAFEVLCKSPLESQYIEKGYYYSSIEPVIKLHPVTNDFFHIRFNKYDRATLTTLPQEKVLKFYAAYQAFGREASSPDNQLQLKLEPGSVIFIDNWRVLHGRNSYKGKRNLCGCYVARAEWLSQARNLGLAVL